MGDESTFDLVIVGGGIGGSSMALVMTQAGYSCLVLERTTSFPDRTRSEWLAPRGVLEAQRLGVDDVLRSARGHVIRRHVTYEPETSPAEAEAAALDLSLMAPGVEGPMTQRHPDACQALFDASGAAGASCLRGVEDVVIDVARAIPIVHYRHDGAEHGVLVRRPTLVSPVGVQAPIRSPGPSSGIGGSRTRKGEPCPTDMGTA